MPCTSCTAPGHRARTGATCARSCAFGKPIPNLAVAGGGSHALDAAGPAGCCSAVADSCAEAVVACGPVAARVRLESGYQPRPEAQDALARLCQPFGVIPCSTQAHAASDVR